MVVKVARVISAGALEFGDPTKAWASGRRTIHVSGVQAVVRFLVEALRADSRQGLRTAAFVSGYQGSPLAGFDLELQGAMRGLDVEIVHQPGVNEELGATAVMGSQLTTTQPSSRYDGVLGVWYGKAPGLDRSMDALRHANYAGASRHGGAIALVGDDPAAKSSTLPSASEAAMAELAMPVLFPRSLADVLELGQHAVAMSRYSGAWVGIKLVTAVADAEGTVAIQDPIEPKIPDDYVASPVTGDLLTPSTLAREPEVLSTRLDAAARYGEANGLNRVLNRPPRPILSLVAPGTVFSELLEALRLLGLDEPTLNDLGIRVGEIRMPFPISTGFANALVSGVDDLVVVEERRDLIERQLLSLVGRGQSGLRIWGRLDPDGQPFVPGYGTLDAASLARLLHPLLSARFGPQVNDPPQSRQLIPVSVGASRVPWYCSGCPHSVSTVVPEGTLVGAGIGCHSIVRFMPEERVGRSIGITQMGGEGAQWIGMAPFLDDSHIVQNLGDGTFFHSGHLAVRAAIAAEVSMTFKILWNGASAMTGGQHIEGSTSTLGVAQLLQTEGVKQVIITTENAGAYRRQRLPVGVTVRSRQGVLDVQRELAQIKGVTVMIHDQVCATDLRRARKRGLAPKPGFKVVINERVCEGCGDCQVKSNCLSLQTVDTVFGPKTRIDQSTCNVDLSCLAGDCPAFTLVKVATENRVAPSVVSGSPLAAEALPPATVPSPGSSLAIRVAGIGGTGVVTTAHLLARAAMLEGLDVWGLDQTGLSQKAGPVVSDIRIGPESTKRSNVLGDGEVDLLVAADLLAACRPSVMAGMSTEHTAVVGSFASTLSGPMILGEQTRRVPISDMQQALALASRPGHATFVDANDLAWQATGGVSTANVVLLGVAYQLGRLPLSEESLTEAIKQNGVAVEANLAAFHQGRAWVLSPSDRTSSGRDVNTCESLHAAKSGLIASYQLPAGYRRHLGVLADELIAYQGRRLATRFLGLVQRTWIVEQGVGGDGALANAVADGSFKLWAYKDEYEVARLLLDRPSAGGPTTWLLHPPMLRARGLGRKIHLGPWARPMMKMLRWGRRLRGTVFDPFGRTELRKVERELARHYVEVIDVVLAGLHSDNQPLAVEIARLPSLVRGYEDVKLASIERYRAELATILRTYRG
jgi:indolepyruvate ferredoxin oxidoreductase